jgi:excisionase family DNA binding protein
MTEPLALTIQQAALAAAASRTTLYAALKAGHLRAVKRGRRTLILQADLRAWLERLPTLDLRPEAPGTPR